MFSFKYFLAESDRDLLESPMTHSGIRHSITRFSSPLFFKSPKTLTVSINIAVASTSSDLEVFSLASITKRSAEKITIYNCLQHISRLFNLTLLTGFLRSLQCTQNVKVRLGHAYGVYFHFNFPGWIQKTRSDRIRTLQASSPAFRGRFARIHVTKKNFFLP